MDRRFKLAVVITAVLFAVVVGLVAYNAGVSHGLAIAPAAAEAPAAGFRPYGWYRPWGFGFFGGPFLFVVFWIFVFRVLFWGGLHRRRRMYAGFDDGAPAFYEWHQRAHERMEKQPPASPESTA